MRGSAESSTLDRVAVWSLFVAAVLHLLVAATVSPSWKVIASGGLWNTVANDDYPAMTTLWFTVSGVAFVGLAVLTRRAWLDTGRVPRETGWTLLAIGMPTAILEPMSGGWLVLAIGAFAVWRSIRVLHRVRMTLQNRLIELVTALGPHPEVRSAELVVRAGAAPGPALRTT